ncbi:MAG: hypothetical protein AAGH88_09560 [Planctomycetota bacterium]
MTKVPQAGLSLVCLLVSYALSYSVAGQEAGEEGYLLVVERPLAAGDRQAVQAAATYRVTVNQSLNGQTIGEDKIEIEAELAGIVEVLEVNDAGQPNAVAVTIQDYEGTYNEVTVPIDMDDRVVIRVVDGEVTGRYENGDRLSPEAVMVMEKLLNFMIHKDDSSTDLADWFALDQRRAPGQSWAGNNPMIAQSMQDDDQMRVDADHVLSKFEFLEIVEFEGQPAMSVAVNLGFTQIDSPMLIEQGYQMRDSRGSVTITGRIPLDPESKGGALDLTSTFRMSAETDLPDNQGRAILSVVMSDQASAVYQPVD